MNPKTVEALRALVHDAGEAILAIYGEDFDVETKADDSPLTQADLAAHAVLVEGLARLTPDIPVLSEEGEPPSFEERQGWSQYWLIDPLDGTKEFVSRNGEFTVNVALIEDQRAVFGVVGVPVQQRIFVGDVAARRAWVFEEGGAHEVKGRARQENETLTVVASRSHGGERLESYLDEVSARLGDVTRKPMGSSLKLCILAEGGADLYPRLGPTSEWDIAAAHAVLSAAGGDLWAADGSPFLYNTKVSLLNPEFVAVADSSYPWRERLPDIPPAE